VCVFDRGPKALHSIKKRSTRVIREFRIWVTDIATDKIAASVNRLSEPTIIPYSYIHAQIAKSHHICKCRMSNGKSGIHGMPDPRNY